jgi:hypothetical protein
VLQSVFSPAPRRGVFTVLQRDDRRFDIQVFITCKIEWQTTNAKRSHFRYRFEGSASITL